MPIRIGFSKFRRQALEIELERVVGMMPQLGVERAVLFGDLVMDRVGPESSIDLIMVQDIPGNFTRRMDFFTSHLGPEVAMNFFVYTPDEFHALRDSDPILRSALSKGRVVHGS